MDERRIRHLRVLRQRQNREQAERLTASERVARADDMWRFASEQVAVTKGRYVSATDAEDRRSSLLLRLRTLRGG